MILINAFLPYLDISLWKVYGAMREAFHGEKGIFFLVVLSYFLFAEPS